MPGNCPRVHRGQFAALQRATRSAWDIPTPALLRKMIAVNSRNQQFQIDIDNRLCNKQFLTGSGFFVYLIQT